MTDEDRELALVGDHAENLHSGRMIAPTERVFESELDEADQWLVDEGRLVPVEVPDEPSVRELRARAAALGIEGRSKMTPEQLQSSIAEAEAPIIAAAEKGVAEGDARKGDEG